MTKNINKLIQDLSDSDFSVRKKAADKLADGDERAIYPLIKALNDENAGVQDTAMRSLIAVGGEVVGYMALPLLRENVYLRNTALIILKGIGEAVVPILYPLLKDKDEDVRKFAADLLGEIKKGVDPSKIAPLLKDTDTNVRISACGTVGALGYRDAILDLVSLLKDDEWVCFYSLEALGELRAEEAVDEIAMLLLNGSDIIRFAATQTLGKIGSQKAADALMAYLPKASKEQGDAIIKSLMQIGITPEISNLPKHFTEHLIKMLKDGDWEEKEIALKGITLLNCKEAVSTIINIAGSLDLSVPESEEKFALLKKSIVTMDSATELIRLLEFSDIKYKGKAFAIEILGMTKNKKAVSHLINFLNDAARDIRRASVKALGEIGDARPVKYLLDVSETDVDAHVRRAAIEAIGNMRAKEAFKPLSKMTVAEKYHDVIESIAIALIKIDSDTFLSDISRYNSSIREAIARTVLDVGILLELANDTNKKVKKAAIYRLGQAGTEKAISQLIAFLKDEDPDIRKAAVVGLGEARYCSSELFNFLQDDDPWMRFYAVRAIVFSCDEEDVIALISAMLNDNFIPVVMSAIDSISEIGGRQAYEVLNVHAEHYNSDVRDKIKEVLNSL